VAGDKGPAKAFLQALIQLTAALHHFQRGNARGAASLMQTAIHRLESYPDSFQGIAVASLCEEISEWQEKLKTEDAPADFAPRRSEFADRGAAVENRCSTSVRL
jgi:predicted metal-dependent hydrolase